MALSATTRLLIVVHVELLCPVCDHEKVILSWHLLCLLASVGDDIVPRVGRSGIW